MNKSESILSKREEIAPNLGLFDRPRLKQPTPQEAEQQPRLRLVFESDPLNTFLVTNPTQIFKLLRPDRFFKLSEVEQSHVIEKLAEVLNKCTFNGHLISEQVVTLNVSRSNQETLDSLRRKLPKCIEQEDTASQETCSSQDVIFQLVHIGLRFAGKSAVKQKIAGQIVEIVRIICRGKRYLKCHLELIYQYVKTKVNKILASSILTSCKPPVNEGYSLIDYCISLLSAIIDQPVEFMGDVPNYFYFSGYLSGILLGDKPVQQWPFIKGFAACMWFRLQEQQAQLQDPQNLPILFNCFSSGFGGFECYFIGFKLYYRILPPLSYAPPTADSNGVLIADFSNANGQKWNFLAIEHEKPFLARAQLIAIVNDKQVLNFPMDYPSFDKANSKLNIVSVCKNMTGQLTSFLLFKDQVNNPYKFVQLYKAYEHGIGARQPVTKLNTDVFDAKLIEKVFLMFTPQRTMNKQVYDYIDQNDGELMINCGVWSHPTKQLLQEAGGLISMLPLLDSITKLIELESDRQSSTEDGSTLVNNFLKLVHASVRSGIHSEVFYQLLLHEVSKLHSSVNCQTIQLLADLRFELGDNQQLNEAFFLNLMETSDAWVNSNNMEVINEYWGFVKAIYSQNPALYNRIYPIRHLVDLMLKLSNISQDGAFCCQYHKKTFQLIMPEIALESSNKHPVLPIRKYLEPIAAVLENVMTIGGEDVLDEVQYIAKSLAAKSCPCFHLQMLQLLKVLLIDARPDSDPKKTQTDPSKLASRSGIRYRFYEVKGLQILLYLCQNAALDVKAMCIKIIDMLSTQTSLIHMRIDTDLITYLSHVILPEQLVQQHLAKQWQTQQLQHAICEEFDMEQKATLQYEFHDEQEEEQFEAPTAPKGRGRQLFVASDDSDESPIMAPPKAVQAAKRGGISLDLTEKEMCAVSQYPTSSKDWAEKFKKDQDAEEKGGNDEDAPKPTADVLMSRNLRGGAKKGFNFAAFAEDDSDSDTEVVMLKPKPQAQVKRDFKMKFPDEDDFQPERKQPPKKLQISSDEESKEESKHGGTTGTTDDIEPKPADDSPKRKKPNFNLAIDTEEINKQFNYGGEHGSMMEEEALAKLENDIQDLAKLCVDAMRKTKKKSTFQELLEQQNLGSSDDEEMKEDGMFMMPQTVKGIKSIEKDILRQEKEAMMQPKKMNFVLEETEQAYAVDSADEAIHSGRVERFLMNLDCDNAKHEKPERTNEFDIDETSDQFTQELESLYTSCLEWLLNRQPSGLFENLVIDDYDKITFKPALQILMTLISFSNNMIRQRALQDLFMLAQWDSYCMQYHDQSQQVIANQNGLIILSYPKFHTWLLELMMPYQELIHCDARKKSTMQTVMSESSRAVYDMGCKLHTLLLKSACLNPEEDGLKKVNLLTRWPALIQAQLEAVDKPVDLVDKMQCSSTDVDFLVQTAHGLTRTLLASLIKQIKEETHQESPQINLASSQYRNIVHITVQIEELILSSHQKQPEELTLNLSAKATSDVNESLFAWLQNGYLLGSSNKAEGELWVEWDLIETLAQSLDWLLKPSGSFAKSAAAIEVLMYEGKPSQPSPVHAATANAKSSKVGAFFSSINNGLNQAVQSLTTQYLDSQQPQVPDCTFMTALMNIVCLAISQAYSKELTAVWVDRLECYVKQLLLVSEAFKTKTDSYFASVQRRLAEQVSFALAFLFHEMHNSGTPTRNQQHFNYAKSPQQTDVQRSKLFQQTLKNLLIFFINIVAPQASSKSKDQSAAKIILQNILVKELSGSTESLFTGQDLLFLKESQFEDLPEMFHQNDWKMTFFHNSVLSAIVHRQLNSKTIEQYDARRRSFVQRLKEVESKTEKAKDEILRKIQTDTLEAISSLSEIEHERKEKVAVLNEHQARNLQHLKLQCLKQVRNTRGMWRQDFVNSFLSACMQSTGEGTKVLLKSIPSNQLTFFKDNEDLKVRQLESHLFLKIFNSQALMLSRCQSYMQLKSALKDCLVIPKQDTSKANKGKLNDSSEASDCEDGETDHQKQAQMQAFQPSQADPFAYVQCLKEHLLQTRTPKRKEVLECKCELLQTLKNRKGIMVMTNYELVFFHAYPSNSSQTVKNTIHFFTHELQPDHPFTKEVPLCNIKELQKRRFIGQRTALEVFLLDGSSWLIKFESQEVRDEIAKKILRQRKNKCKNLKYYTSLEPKWILKKKGLTEDWQNWKISNFDYLMQLNQLAGRSYYDLSQYPVLPWVFNTYVGQKTPDLMALNAVARGGAPPGQFRDLTKNMQLLGSAVRQAEFKRKFEDSESFIGLEDRFHCGSHYSNPGIVLHYLSRTQPYLQANVELHGKTMDHPDRVFTSVEYSFSNALNDFSDVRELIPEFYFLPEMFLNLNNANFGVKQDGSRVTQVKLPPWANKDPFKFVQTMREAMESPYVSANMHTWIDFVFGYKQRGPDAQMSLNTFSKITYQPESPEDFDISSEPDPVLRSAYENQAYNYGQTPTQLFKQPERHPQKLNKLQALRSNLVVDADAHLKVFKPVSAPKAVAGKAPKQNAMITKDAVLKARFVDDQRIVAVTKDNYCQQFVWLPKAHDLNPSTPFSLGSDKKLQFDSHEKEHGLEQFDRSLKKFDAPIHIMKEGRLVAKGGFWDNRIAFCPTEGSGETYFELYGHTSTVMTIVCDKKESVMITGAKSGEVIIWKHSDFDYTLLNNDPKVQQPGKWVCFKKLHDHDRQVSSLFLNEEMGLFVTGSYDGTCNLYNMHTGKLLRCFKHPTLAPVYAAFIALTPVAICAFFSREDHMWTVYSINGTLLSDPSQLAPNEKALQLKTLQEECSHIIACQVIKDSMHIDKLVYGTEKGHVIIRSLPDMTRIRKLVVATNNPVLSILVSPDRRFLHVGCGDGGLIVITERNAAPQEKKK